jgi:hypothetical protein
MGYVTIQGYGHTGPYPWIVSGLGSGLGSGTPG